MTVRPGSWERLLQKEGQSFPQKLHHLSHAKAWKPDRTYRTSDRTKPRNMIIKQKTWLLLMIRTWLNHSLLMIFMTLDWKSLIILIWWIDFSIPVFKMIKMMTLCRHCLPVTNLLTSPKWRPERTHARKTPGIRRIFGHPEVMDWMVKGGIKQPLRVQTPPLGRVLVYIYICT